MTSRADRTACRVCGLALTQACEQCVGELACAAADETARRTGAPAMCGAQQADRAGAVELHRAWLPADDTEGGLA